MILPLQTSFLILIIIATNFNQMLSGARQLTKGFICIILLSLIIIALLLFSHFVDEKTKGKTAYVIGLRSRASMWQIPQVVLNSEALVLTRIG